MPIFDPLILNFQNALMKVPFTQIRKCFFFDETTMKIVNNNNNAKSIFPWECKSKNRMFLRKKHVKYEKYLHIIISKKKIFGLV